MKEGKSCSFPLRAAAGRHSRGSCCSSAEFPIVPASLQRSGDGNASSCKGGTQGRTEAVEGAGPEGRGRLGMEAAGRKTSLLAGIPKRRNAVRA